MNKPATIPTPTKYMLRRSAARGLPLLFFAVVCGLSGLLWKYQSRSEVLVGEVEVIEHLVASPGSGTVSQLVPSEGQDLDTYVSVAKNQLLIQLDDAPIRSQLDSIEQELLAVSDEVTNELTRLKLGSDTTKVVAVTSDEAVETETKESSVEAATESEDAAADESEPDDVSSDEAEATESNDDSETPATDDEAEAVPAETQEPSEEETSEEPEATESETIKPEANEPEANEPETIEPEVTELENIESDVWIATQSLVDQSLAAIDVARKELDLRQLDTELANAKSELMATGGDLKSLASFEQERRGMNDAIFEMKSELDVDRVSAFAEIPQESLSATSRLVFRSLRNRVKSAESQLSAVQTNAERLDVVSPVDGQIEQTLVQLSQAVTAGQPMLTVIPQRGTMVVVYVREQSLFRPFAGMPVILRSRSNLNQQVDAVVEAVGPKVEEIPQRHRKDPKIVEWGRPMRIRVPVEWNIEPGSLLDVILD